jgi:hypothetical protein
LEKARRSLSGSSMIHIKTGGTLDNSLTLQRLASRSQREKPAIIQKYLLHPIIRGKIGTNLDQWWVQQPLKFPRFYAKSMFSILLK